MCTKYLLVLCFLEYFSYPFCRCHRHTHFLPGGLQTTSRWRNNYPKICGNFHQQEPLQVSWQLLLPNLSLLPRINIKITDNILPALTQILNPCRTGFNGTYCFRHDPSLNGTIASSTAFSLCGCRNTLRTDWITGLTFPSPYGTTLSLSTKYR